MNAKPLEVEESRNHNQELLEIAERFKPAPLDRVEGTCGNIRSQVEGDLHTPTTWDSSFAGNVSAPYLLARLCAMFAGLNIETGGQEMYKITWQTVIEHVETGHVVTFYDYKGGAAFGSDVYGNSAPKAFIDDVKNLIAALRDSRFPHPYDGCVVGEVA